MNAVTFLVQGSQPDPYAVTFANSGEGNLTATCSCPAGRMQQHCKHRHNILLGDVSDIVSGNVEMTGLLYEWFRGSDVEAAMREIDAVESEMAELKKTLAKAKRRFADALKD